MTSPTTGIEKQLPAFNNIRVAGGALNGCLQCLQVEDYVVNGLHRYFRVGFKTCVNVVGFVCGRDADVLVVGADGLLKEIIDASLLSEPANIPTVVYQRICAHVDVGRNAYPVRSARNAVVVAVVRI